MTLNTMQRCVLQAGYSANIGNGVIAQVLDGGAPRFRRALKGTVHSGNVSWYFFKMLSVKSTFDCDTSMFALSALALSIAFF